MNNTQPMTSTTQDKTYNGWTNYETWNIALWIDNDEGLQETVNEQAKEFAQNPTFNKLTEKDMTEYNFSEWLKEWFEEMNPLASDASVWADLMNAALSEVNWREIAEHYLSNVETE